MDGVTYVALSAQIALRNQLDVVANNVANTNTNGYKPDRELFQSYVEKLDVPGGTVSFVQDRATYVDRQDGEISLTGNDWDIAIKGDGFLALTSGQQTIYTRDGHLQTAQDGTLQSSSGLPVQGPDGQPIQVPAGASKPRITADGAIEVRINGGTQQIGQIGLFKPTEPLALRKVGGAAYSAPPNVMQPIDNGDPTVRVVQGGLEGSTVQPVAEIANLTELGRAYDRLESLIGDDNDREQKMIQTLGQPA